MLAGGADPTRGVVRVGDTVRRPPMRVAVRALLGHLETVGFAGAPRHLGIDEQGRDILTWIDGEVPLPPYPAWALTDRALASVGRLLRAYHEAAAGFRVPEGASWSGEWSDPGGGPVICHNDVFPENTVFRDGEVVALIDFDMAAPGRPWWDLAVVAEEWAPLHAPGARLSTPDALDAVPRVGLLAEAYGLPAGSAEEFLDVVAEVKAQSTASMRAQAAAGDPVWVEHLATTRFEERVEADGRWLADVRPDLIAEVTRRTAAGAAAPRVCAATDRPDIISS